MLFAEPAPAGAHAGHCKEGPAEDLESAPGAGWVEPPLALRLIGTFAQPTYVTGAPRDRQRLFVVEREGLIRIVMNGRTLGRPFLDLTPNITTHEESEQGLFSMAFAPDYQTSGLFYVSFSDRNGHNRIQEFRRSRHSPNRADPRSRRELLFVPHRGKVKYHYGGQLEFGLDGLLWISLGDGKEKRKAQDLGSLRGKILRIDPRRSPTRPYSVPRSNPFVGRPGARPEVYFYGLRNPFRFSFDRSTGDLFIGDVGDEQAEEIDFVPGRDGGRVPRGGRNFGWPLFEATIPRREGQEPPQRYAPPALELLHPENHAVTGGYVVRDRRLGELYGRYVYGDFCAGTLLTARLPVDATDNQGLGLTVTQPTSFGEDTRGQLHVASLWGAVYRLDPRDEELPGGVPPPLRRTGDRAIRRSHRAGGHRDSKCPSEMSGRSRTRTWDLFLIREAL